MILSLLYKQLAHGSASNALTEPVLVTGSISATSKRREMELLIMSHERKLLQGLWTDIVVFATSPVFPPGEVFFCCLLNLVRMISRI
jgi:hypothetical protein